MLNEKKEMGRDRVYKEKQAKVTPFEFNSEVVSVFPDMVQRSIPGYSTVVQMSGIIASQMLSSGTVCYDLGCSLGASTRSVLSAVGDAAVTVVGVDSSAPMVHEARKRISDPRVEFHVADVRSFNFEPAKVMILNFVLQFVGPNDREALLRNIRAALEPNGLLIVSEKINAIPEFEDLHLQFKKFNDYSDLEIAQKRQALENVMRINSSSEHLARLSRTGFKNPRMWYQCLNWASFLANA